MGKGVTRLDNEVLRHILQLDDCQIVAISPGLQGKYLEILVESDNLPEVEEDQPYPTVIANYKVEYHPDDHEFKKVSVRLRCVV